MFIDITLYCPKGNDTYRKSWPHTYLDNMRGSKTFILEGGVKVLTTFFRHQRIPQRTVRTFLEMQLEQSRVSVPEFLWKPIATCDLSEVGV